MSTSELIQQALDLPEHERFHLVEAIMDSFPAGLLDHPVSDAEFSAELRRRGEEMASDPSACVSMADVRRQVEAEIASARKPS
jgi:putative addiction module component (TIGR02574 family)